MSCRRSAFLPLQALALSVGLVAGPSGPAAAQSVRDTAIENCLARVNMRTGGNARVVRSDPEHGRVDLDFEFHGAVLDEMIASLTEGPDQGTAGCHHQADAL